MAKVTPCLIFLRGSIRGRTLIAESQDLEAAKELLKEILEANRLGFPPYVYTWYNTSLKKLLEEKQQEGLTKSEFSRSYFNQFKTRLSDKSRKRLITVLEEGGFIEERTDPEDKRTTKLYALGVGGGKE